MDEKILVIVAHPDDAELSCGGTVAKWTEEGKGVQYLVLTSGEKGTKDLDVTPYRLAETREREQEEAAKVLGVKSVTFLRLNDGELEANSALRSRIALLIRAFQPDIIVTHDPWRPYLFHPDHRAVGFAVVDAVVSARDHLFLPEQLAVGFKPHSPRQMYFTFPEKPDLIVDITTTMEKKLDALSKHKTQLERIPDWREKIRQRAAELAKEQGFQYAETFRRVILF